MHTLEIEAVTKVYRGGVQALRGISLVLQPGIVGLIGPNGAGKSSLMRILATLAKPTTGIVRWDGVDIVRDPRSVRRILGYVPQDAGVYPHLNAREFLAYIAALKMLGTRPARAQIEELLSALELVDIASRPLGTLSGGNRQRVAIASALLGDPKLLIVDEPTVGLDPEQRIRFRRLLVALARDRIILLSTHIVSDIESAADRIIIVSGGIVAMDGSPAEVAGTHGSLESAYLAAVGYAA